jgi:hypothetical protein
MSSRVRVSSSSTATNTTVNTTVPCPFQTISAHRTTIPLKEIPLKEIPLKENSLKKNPLKATAPPARPALRGDHRRLDVLDVCASDLAAVRHRIRQQELPEELGIDPRNWTSASRSSRAQASRPAASPLGSKSAPGRCGTPWGGRRPTWTVLRRVISSA